MKSNTISLILAEIILVLEEDASFEVIFIYHIYSSQRVKHRCYP